MTFAVGFRTMCPTGPFSLFSVLSDAVLFCPHREFHVCDLIFYNLIFFNISDTFVYECLEISDCSLGHSPLLSMSQDHRVTRFSHCY